MVAINAWAQQPNRTFLAQPFFDSLKKWAGQEIDDIPLDFLLHLFSSISLACSDSCCINSVT